MRRWRRKEPGPPPWISAVVALAAITMVVAEHSEPGGEFVAGSFILTQKALDEAPYRYSTFLTEALEAMQMKDPPTKSDEENCNVRYRIEPSGQRSSIDVDKESLSVRLLRNNTVVMTARLEVAVPARTWIWKGINFGFLGCMKISSCGGQVVTYSARISMQVAFQVTWDEVKKKISVLIKPVETELSDVNVVGCRPPWYLWWFKSWQEMLNNGVQQAFQDFADNFSHSLSVPEEMTIHKNIFISYKVTNLIWSQHFVAFEATSTFKALINGRNITFVPSRHNASLAAAEAVGGSIPIGQWAQSSSSDDQSHLLQGVRLSGYFLNSIMWYASITNATEYQGNTTVLDSQINGTISYTPPILTVAEGGVLNITVPQGKLLATCRPLGDNINNGTAAVLFKAEFTDMAGSGRVKLAPGNRTGIVVEIQDLDLSNLKTKPFEPKLPLPDTFESDLMKTGIAQLRPIINQYLVDKPIYLPERISPLVAYPEVFLNQTASGLGYAQILSYCTCSDFQAPGAFSKCDERSGLCKVKHADTRRRKRRELTAVEQPDATLQAGGSSGGGGVLPKIATFINQSAIFHKVIDAANDFIDSRLFNKSSAKPKTPEEEEEAILSRRLPLTVMDPTPVYLVQFEGSANCSLETAGASAKTYRLTPRAYCSPITVGTGSLATAAQYYVFKPDGSRILFGCFDKYCKTCSFDVDVRERDACVPVPGQSQSFILSGQPNRVEDRLGENNGTLAVSMFFDPTGPCDLAGYSTPPPGDKNIAAMLTSTYQLGWEDAGCQQTPSGGFLRVERASAVSYRAQFECGTNCTFCSFDLPSLIVGGPCQPWAGNTSLFRLHQASFKTPIALQEEAESEQFTLTIILAVSLALTSVFLILLTAATVWCLQTGKSGDKRIVRYIAAVKARLVTHGQTARAAVGRLVQAHLGFRFLVWAGEERKLIFEDIVQNLFLLANGICAVLFAFEWNSPHNPMYLFTAKLSSKVGVGSAVLELSEVLKFTDSLNFYTFLVNLINGTLAFVIVVAWAVTRSGSRERWTRLRLASATMMLATLLLTIACVIFTTYFDDLIRLKSNSGYFIADNAKMRVITEGVIKVSLNGLSLTVISFTIVFLFHGVGGGLFSGTVLFRILHLYSKKEDLEILTTLLVILTIIQPFICLHPVIIWSQDSDHNALYLILTIFVWFLPLLVHLVIKFILTNIISRRFGGSAASVTAATSLAELTPLNTGISPVTTRGQRRRQFGAHAASKTSLMSKADFDSASSSPAPVKTPSTVTQISRRMVTLVDVGMQVVQLVVFLVAFSFVTDYIVNTELDSSKANLKKFVLPAIVSVFVWMTSISYFLLDLTMNATKESVPLVFKDEGDEAAVAARNELRQSLRRRLELMDKRSTIGGPLPPRMRPQRPMRPPPPPPVRPKPTEHRDYQKQGRPPIPPKPSLALKSINTTTVTTSANTGLSERSSRLPPPVAPKPKAKRQLSPVEQQERRGINPEDTVVNHHNSFLRSRSLPPGSRAKYIRGGPRCLVDTDLGASSDSLVIQIREAAQEADSLGGGRQPEGGNEAESVTEAGSRVTPFAIEEEEGEQSEIHSEARASCCARTLNYLLEREEYAFPELHGWRIRFRRIFLHLGVLGFSYTTYQTIQATQTYSAKKEIQTLLDYVGTNLTWPDEGSAFDEVFELYNGTQTRKSYVMIAASVLFWSSLIFDMTSYATRRVSVRRFAISASRVVNFLGSLLVFASVILVGLPDYLEASHLDRICPYCGTDFNRTVKQVAEFSIGLFFACLFTFQLLPVLMTIAPALVRASVLILIHPGLRSRDKTTVLRMSILQKVIVVSSLLSFPITFVSMCIVDQHQKDVIVTVLIILFWVLPPVTLYVGLYYSRVYQKYSILLFVYYMYNFVYVGLVMALLLYSFKLQQFLRIVRNLLESPTVWFGTMAQVFLCNVVISDLLYMTVF